MKRKLIALLTAFVLILLCVPTLAFASETVRYSITAPVSAVKIGSEFDVIISLSDYASMLAEIQGVQIDITNIDSNVLEVVSHSTLVVDSGAASNKTSYSSTSKYVRYVYLNMSGTMIRTVTDLMTVRFKVKSTLTSDGSVSLPVKLKIGTKTGTQTDSITLEDSVVINYVTAFAENISTSTGSSSADVKAKYNAFSPADVYSVDITWGAMEFDYNAGGQKWDNEAHKYVDDEAAPAAWSVHNSSNTITLENNSSKAVNASFAFNADSSYTGITGEFTNVTGGNIKLNAPLALAKPQADTPASAYVVSFMPSGALASSHSSSSYAKIGSITVTLG